MKKSIAVLFFCLVFAQPLSSRPAFQEPKPPKSDRESRNLLGPVESVRYEWCSLSEVPNGSGEYGELARNYVQSLTFDNSGKTVLQDPRPYVCATSRFIEASQRHSRKYDKNGNEVEDIVTDLKGRVIHTIVQAFDPAGNRTEVAYYNPDGTLDFKWLRRFDEGGNEVETMRFGKGGVYQFTEVRTYNDKGQWIEFTRYESDGSVHETSRKEFEYDSYGNWVKSIESELVTESGNSFFKPTRIDYRFITYFLGN